MKKDTIRLSAVAVVFLLVYHLLAFLIPFEKTDVFWFSYAFTLVAFAVTFAAFYKAFCKKEGTKSKFYGFPIARIGAIYFIYQMVLGIVFMALAGIALWWIPVLLYVVALAAAIVGLISADAVIEEIHTQDDKLKKDVSLMRALQSKVNQLVSQCEDFDTAKKVKAFADEIRYSDPVSNEEIREVEADLSAVVDELQKAVVDGDAVAIKQLCRKASAVLSERNRLCKLNKV